MTDGTARPIFDVFTEIATWTNFADELSKRGITGTPECTNTCPMANFIIRETSRTEVAGIRVESKFTTYWGASGSERDISNPLGMTHFIAEFDDGEFPDLSNDPAYWSDFHDEHNDSDE